MTTTELQAATLTTLTSHLDLPPQIDKKALVVILQCSRVPKEHNGVQSQSSIPIDKNILARRPLVVCQPNEQVSAS